MSGLPPLPPAAGLRAVLLDLDGTLLDSAPGIIASHRATFRALGLPVPAEERLRAAIGPPLQESMRGLGLTGATMERALVLYREDYSRTAAGRTSVFSGVRELLARLRAAGLRLAVATSKLEPAALDLVDALGLAPALDEVLGATLDGARRAKADVVAAALARLGVAAASTAMLGDREHDVLGARAHGVACIGASWGYGAPGELTGAGAVALAASPGDVPALLGLAG